MSTQTTKWYTVTVVPGREMLVASRLEAEDLRKPIPGFVRAYSPYENVITENEKGSKTKQMALCVGYIFVEVTNIKGIIGVLRTLDGAIGTLNDRQGIPIETRRSEVEKFMGKVPQKVVFKYTNFIENETLKVVDGSFEGKEVKFLSYVDEDKSESIVEITIMNNPVTMKFETSNLNRNIN